MTLPAFNELCRYWEKYPPTHLLLRAYVGYTPRVPAAEASGNLGELFALVPTGTLAMGVGG